MKTLLLLLLSPFAALGETDSEFATKLIGVWAESRAPEPGKRHEQKIELTSDGRFVVTGKEVSAGQIRPFVFKGTWWVKDGRYAYKSSFSEPADVFPVGTAYSDKIIAVSDLEWIMEEASTGNKSVAKKQK